MNLQPALDPNLRDEIAETLVNLQIKFGFLMLFVTHDINLASKICDDLLVLRDGRVIEKGKSSILLGTPQTSYTKSLIESSFANREFRK